MRTEFAGCDQQSHLGCASTPTTAPIADCALTPSSGFLGSKRSARLSPTTARCTAMPTIGRRGQERPLIGMWLELVVDEHAVAALARRCKDAILASVMGFDHLVGGRNERLVRALTSTNLRLAANTAHPLVSASWSIAAAAGFRILPGEHSVRPANNLRKRAILSAAGEPLVTVAASEGGGEGFCSLAISRRLASRRRRSISRASSWARMRLASSCRCVS